MDWGHRPYSSTEQSVVEDAFQKWIYDFVPYANPAGLSDKTREERIKNCVEKFVADEKYSKDATITAMLGDKVLFSQNNQNDDIAKADCRFFGSVTHSKPYGEAKDVECTLSGDGTARCTGYFPKFVDAKESSLQALVSPVVQEENDRYFDITGHLNDKQKFVADKDVTCFGPCPDARASD